MLKSFSYHLTEELSQSANISLSRGVRDSDGTAVLVKWLRDEYPALNDLRRLQHEYQVTKNLEIEGVTQPLGLESSFNGLALLLRDYGAQTLDTFLGGSPLEVTQFLRIALQLAGIVGQVHWHKIIHQDIKPQHVLIHPDTLKIELTGFGDAVLSRGESANASADTVVTHSIDPAPKPALADAALLPSAASTASPVASDALNSSTRLAPEVVRSSPEAQSSNQLSGTLAYMSPEQTGRTAQDVDHRTDFYALGAMFYEMLTGHTPFEGSDALEILHAHLAKMPTAPRRLNPAIPTPLSQIVLKLLAKAPHERYQSAYGLKADLDRCATSWQRRLTIEPFALGAHDFSGQLKVSSRLYGRESGVEELWQSFMRVKGGTAELFFVTGYSGIGKSSVVREIRQRVVREGAYFVSGKFEQLRRDEPYSAILQTLQQLLTQILIKNETVLQHWKTHLQEAVGDNGQVVLEVLPEAALIFDAAPQVPPLGAREAQNRLLTVFRQIIASFCDADHPVVLFLDDLQWADAASLKLLRELEIEDRIPYFLLIGAYRDNEVDTSHPVLLLAEEVRKVGCTVHVLHLGALQIAHVIELVADTLGCDAGRATPVAELIWHKTAGNPFFINQLLHSLVREEWLFFDRQQSCWSWSLERLQSAEITENVVELVAKNISGLSRETQNTLMVASCIGNTFNLELLIQVAEQPSFDCAAQMWEALREGLLLSLDDQTFKFAHDRIQQAAQSLLSESERQHRHLQIGRLLLKKNGVNEELGLESAEATLAHSRERPSAQDAGEHAFAIVEHFNQALELLSEPSERKRVMRLNLRAAGKARRVIAYDAALRYFSIAADLLSASSWDDDYPTTFAVYKELAQCTYLVGHSQQAQTLFDLLNSRARTALDRAEVVRIQLQLCTILNDFTKAIQIGLQGLEQLNFKLPSRPSHLTILREVLLAQRNQGQRRIADLSDAPHLHDAHHKAVLELLSNLVAPLYVSGNQHLFSLVVLKMTNLSLRYGNADVSSQAYALYGVILGSGLSRFRRGYEWGEMALRLCEQFDNDDQKCKTFFTFPCYLSPWRQPLSYGEAYFRQSYELGLASGNTVFAGYGLVNATAYGALRGKTLTEVCDDVERFLPVLKWTKDPNQLAMALFTRQMSRCLQGATTGPCQLSDGHYQEETLLAGLQDNAAARLWYYIVKLKVCYLGGDFKQALEMAQRAERDLSPLFGTPYIVEEKFFYLLTLTALYPTSSLRDRRRTKRILRRILKNLKTWAANAPDCVHKYLLAQAEVARVYGTDITSLYDAAAQAAREAGYVQDEALAFECAAVFYEAQGNARSAHSYLMSARYAYMRWGATAKITALEGRYPLFKNFLAEDTPQRTEIFDDKRDQVAFFDLTTVVKVTQALLSEMDLARLMDRLLCFAIENAGAATGLLLLEKSGQLHVEAKVSSDGAAQILQALPIEDDLSWPTAIINYVARMRENLILSDPASWELFTSHPAMVNRRPKSVLCVPLLRRSTLIGVLYLENDLAFGAFTPEKVQLCRVIASQAVIALENALLYNTLREAHENLEESNRTLEQKVAQRTEQLAAKNDELEITLHRLTEMQDKIVMQEKVASLGALTAGIAHEIKNPLNFINNFAEISAELTREIRDVFRAQYAQVLDAPSSAAIEVLLNDVTQNLCEINAHGKRADSIINAMLLHSRGQIGQHQACEINAIAREAVHLAYHAMRARQPDFGVRIEEHYDEGIRDIVLVPQEMSRVLLNIVNNACYATHQKQIEEREQGRDYTPTLTIQTRERDDHIEIRIGDNGNGMPNSIAREIFNPFFTTKPAREGTGLGLSMSYDIVTQLHGGSLSVETEEGRGTQFLIFLPRHTL